MRGLIDFNCFFLGRRPIGNTFMTRSEDLRWLEDNRSCSGDYDPTQALRMVKLLKGHQIAKAESGTKTINSSSFVIRS